MRRLRKSFIKWMVVSLICLLLGFLLGKFKQNMLHDSLALMEVDLQALQVDQLQLVKQIATFQGELLADKQTIKQLSQENKKLNEQLTLSANKLYFYERVVAPELDESGVKVYSFSVSKNLQTEQWSYELVLMQAKKGRRYLKGDFTLTFSVFENEVLKNIPLSLLSDTVQSKFKFKYFQTIKGTFTIPEKMTVDELTLQVNVPGNRWHKGQTLEERYDWQTLTEKVENNTIE